MGMTMAEKILAAKAGRDQVRPREIVTCKIDRLMLESFDPDIIGVIKEIGITKVWDSERIVVIHDHEVPPASVEVANMYAESRRMARSFGLKYFFDMGNHGICHQLFVERGFALPGQLVVGNDSHVTTYGAFNAASRGIMEEVPHVLVKGVLWFRVPESVRVILRGELPRLVSSKDLILFLASRLGIQMTLNRSIEFVGPTIKGLSIESRMVLSNMAVDLGAKFAIMESDQKTLEYLAGRAVEPFTPVSSDPDADFHSVHEVDVSGLDPLVACPHELRNVRPVREVKGVKIHQAFLGSCTNGRLEDMQIAAQVLRGRKVHPDVRMIVTPASQAVFREMARTGLMEVFLDAGAIVTNSTCGACTGLHLGVLGHGDTCISSGSRNYKGRMGSPEAQIYLASPATVAASAVAGEIIDPRFILTD